MARFLLSALPIEFGPRSRIVAVDTTNVGPAATSAPIKVFSTPEEMDEYFAGLGVSRATLGAVRQKLEQTGGFEFSF
jgi:hypothetical protein